MKRLGRIGVNRRGAIVKNIEYCSPKKQKK